MKERADFLRCARAGRQGTSGMMVQARQRRTDEAATGIRVGFTCTKKVGNAVARNRAKRRLREAARMVLPEHGRDAWDYVLIGRAEATAARPFEDLKRDLISALKKLHQTRP
jgi:ribonuclease P protein component